MTKRLKKWIVAATFLLAAGIVVLLASHRPAPPSGPVSAQLLEAGQFEVRTLDLDLKDESRVTNANGDAPELPSRTLPATVWYPDGGSHHPLIVSSHGFSSLRGGANYLARALTRLGYVVVSADYPLTNFFARGGPNVFDVVNQPADVSFLIDSMLAFNADPSHPLHNMIDPQRIGATGISLGGMTSMMAGFDPHRMDQRIKAVASVAGPTMMFGPRWFAHRQLPFLMVATPTDVIIKYEDHARPILKNVAGGLLVSIADASHTGFAGAAKLTGWMVNPDLIGCAVITHNLAKSGAGLDDWYQQMGSSEDGVINTGRLRICETDPLPKTVNPIYQHWLTMLAVTSFFEAHLNSDANVRAQRLQYLTEIMPREIATVKVEHADVVATATPVTTQTADASGMANR